MTKISTGLAAPVLTVTAATVWSAFEPPPSPETLTTAVVQERTSHFFPDWVRSTFNS